MIPFYDLLMPLIIPDTVSNERYCDKNFGIVRITINPQNITQSVVSLEIRGLKGQIVIQKVIQFYELEI